jgi:hypothetical protein
MSPAALASYERMKLGGGVKGWSTPYDPWSWSNSTAADAWAGSERSNPGIWPPDPTEERAS